MILYNNFIGIDIGKFTFVTSLYGDSLVKEYVNNSSGINAFIKDHKRSLSGSLSVLETTGGYEMSLLLTLCKKGFKVHRANTRKVKNFIRSFGDKAKTDSLDAKALALYGFERSNKLEVFTPPSPKTFELYELVARRRDLKDMIVSEKNRHQAPRSNCIKDSCAIIIKALEEQVVVITDSINQLIESDNTLKAKKAVIMTVPGIGNIIANELLILMPELGSLDRRKIASLGGIAPKANDSGKFRGYRRTGHGRSIIKPILFLAAMAARNSKTELKVFYENLITKGKKKMVALVALMRKILVIANARLRDLTEQIHVLNQSTMCITNLNLH